MLAKAIRAQDVLSYCEPGWGGCLIWTGSINKDTGYGQVWFNKTTTPAHRAAYEQNIGPIPEGLTLDHLCRVRLCIRPKHLDPVTSAENTRRRSLAVLRGRHGWRAECPNGHFLSYAPLVELNPNLTNASMVDIYVCQRCNEQQTRELNALYAKADYPKRVSLLEAVVCNAVGVEKQHSSATFYHNRRQANDIGMELRHWSSTDVLGPLDDDLLHEYPGCFH